jgi:hypothetical protein
VAVQARHGHGHPAQDRQYTLKLPLGFLPSYTHVTAHGSGYCTLTVRNDGTKDDVTFNVACFTPGGAAANGSFDLTYMTVAFNER